MTIDPQKRLELFTFFVFLLVAWVGRAFFDAVVLGGVVSILAWPLHERIGRRCKGPKVHAAVTLSLLIVVVLIPLSGGLLLAIREIGGLMQMAVSGIQSGAWAELLRKGLAAPGMAPVIGWAGGPELALEKATVMAQDGALSIAGAVSERFGSAATFTAKLILDVMVFLLMLLALLLHGPALVAAAESRSFLQPSHTRQLFDTFSAFTRTVVLGSGAAALAQALVAGIGFTIFGAERPLVLAILTIFLGYIPVVGTSLVWIPVTVKLVADGRTGAAIGLVIWSLVLTGSIDNVVKPIFMRGKSDIPLVLIFIGIFGGIATFGASGLIIGPTLVAMLLALIRIASTTEPASAPSPKDAPPKDK